MLFFFDSGAPTSFYTLSLHDALPISVKLDESDPTRATVTWEVGFFGDEEHSSESSTWKLVRSEEHTSELQSRRDLVCRLLLEKKKKKGHQPANPYLIPHGIELASVIH